MRVRMGKGKMMAWWEGMKIEYGNDGLMSDWIFLVVYENLFLLLWLGDLKL